ncbi:flagellar motor protein [Alicyclobacillus tolerans]|uniref:flagellar motor protein n=1 Tax=Alicyclobacillus tolerans TaxID=90970 RepID=UPI001F27C0B7|nr:flagellar motor protein [Alicyclobacillus tolerans]MCF8563843.1 flagellar motor protein [Alicyclobacillus tolerans]
MDFATVGGVVLAVASLVIAFVVEGGTVMALLQPTAALIVFGGTLGAALTSVSMSQFLSIGKYLKVALFHRASDSLATIDQLVELAVVARREGILALEERGASFTDEFLRNGIQWIVDGVDPELVKSMMETELSYLEERHESAAGLFEAAGGYAPTMGIIGTVMGLVHVLSNLNSVDTLGPKIAVAFIATLYGVASANVFWLPIASKLKRRNEEEVLLKEIVMEGVLSIQAGENPNVLRQKLTTFLAPKARERRKSREAGEADAQTAEA